MKSLLLGGAGFLGSHLAELLLKQGHEVWIADNLCSGKLTNLAHLNIVLAQGDACDNEFIARLKNEHGPFGRVYYLASPASPWDYQYRPLETWKANTIGLKNALDLAYYWKARVLFTSTSECYGSPTVSPQPESYWGNVNSYGPRAMYDESKRAGEALCWVYQRHYYLDVRIPRIFNSYGPRLRAGDGRVVSNFIVQMLTGKPVTIYGDGTQTRSFCYVSDTVEGLYKLMEAERSPDGSAIATTDGGSPVNIGNPNEMTMLDLVYTMSEVLGKDAILEFKPLPKDDPPKRCPDISKAKRLLGWEPKVSLREGLKLTGDWFRKELEK